MCIGNYGWSYEDVLPYFKKSEDNRNPYLARDRRHHGTGGYLTVQEPPWKTPIAVAFVEAGVELGYENRDCNGAQQTGFMLPQATQRNKDFFKIRQYFGFWETHARRDKYLVST